MEITDKPHEHIKTFCCRCGTECKDMSKTYEVDALESDIKTIDCGDGYKTVVDEIGQRIIVCFRCVTFSERREGNTCA